MILYNTKGENQQSLQTIWCPSSFTFISTLPSFTRNDNANIISTVWAKDVLFNTRCSSLAFFFLFRRSNIADIFLSVSVFVFSVGSASCRLRGVRLKYCQKLTNSWSVYVKKLRKVGIGADPSFTTKNKLQFPTWSSHQNLIAYCFNNTRGCSNISDIYYCVIHATTKLWNPICSE
jgi:hypothetical protein